MRIKQKTILNLLPALMFLIVIFSCTRGDVDIKEPNLPTIETHIDYSGVHKAIENYITGIYGVDTTKIEESVDTTLRKVGYWYDDATEKYIDNMEMTYDILLASTKEWNLNGDNADNNSKKDIKVFEINEKTAIGKVTAIWGVDYFQLAKINGSWKIMNIIWEGKNWK